MSSMEEGFRRRRMSFACWVIRFGLPEPNSISPSGSPASTGSTSQRLASGAAATFEMVGAAPMLARPRALLEPEMARNSTADDEHAVAQTHSLTSE